MQFEEQTAAIRQMKELLRDQAKFRAKLDRVVRKIETSSERTAKLAERNKARTQKMNAKQTGNGNGNGHGRPTPHKSDGEHHEADGEGESLEALTSVPQVL